MEILRDKNGKTEREFLRDYDASKYFRPSVTVDAVLYCSSSRGLRILFVERGGHPYIGHYAFPGGFVERDEACETAVLRELEEETGIVGVPLRQFITASTPDRDPRYRNITVVFCGAVNTELQPCAGDDAAAAKWFTVERKADGTLTFDGGDEKFVCKLDIVRDEFGRVDINKTEIVERGRMAFDHAKLVWYLSEVIEQGELGGL